LGVLDGEVEIYQRPEHEEWNKMSDINERIWHPNAALEVGCIV
jgi:hypothetical protein